MAMPAAMCAGPNGRSSANGFSVDRSLDLSTVRVVPSTAGHALNIEILLRAPCKFQYSDLNLEIGR